MKLIWTNVDEYLLTERTFVHETFVFQKVMDIDFR